MNRALLVCLFLMITSPKDLTWGQVPGDSIEETITQKEHETKEETERTLVPELKYIKQPGLANAASKIYSADQRFTISGFGEVNGIHYLGEKSRSGEMETYYTNLYRSGTYIGYKVTDNIIFNSEIQLEYLHDGFRSDHFEANFEAMVDYLFHPAFNLRVGNYPIPLGYVNINEEPIAFYTVNRPEVERIIIPTQWLDLGFMFYGSFAQDWEYNLGLTKGLDATQFSESTWIRDGRFLNLDSPQDLAVNGKIQYEIKNVFQWGLSGYHGGAGNGHRTPQGAPLNPSLTLLSSFLEYNIDQWSFFALASHGWLTQTDAIHSLTEEVLGAQTYGYYGEVRYDIQPHLNQKSPWKIPLFVRYERLNTHASIDPTLSQLDRDQRDLSIWTFGFNLRPRKNIVIKADFQYRDNLYAQALEREAHRIELGVGFIY